MIIQNRTYLGIQINGNKSSAEFLFGTKNVIVFLFCVERVHGFEGTYSNRHVLKDERMYSGTLKYAYNKMLNVSSRSLFSINLNYASRRGFFLHRCCCTNTTNKQTNTFPFSYVSVKHECSGCGQTNIPTD